VEGLIEVAVVPGGLVALAGSDEDVERGRSAVVDIDGEVEGVGYSGLNKEGRQLESGIELNWNK
jgi:hypothetical protein